MRKTIHETVHLYDTTKGKIYKFFMICVIITSIVPLTMKSTCTATKITDAICLSIYVLDYMARWITADYKFGVSKPISFIRYPFRVIAAIDFLSIIALAASVFNWKSFLEVAGFAAVFRIIRIFRYSKSVRTILGILSKSKKPLAAVGSLAIGYIIVSAIIVFNVEPNSFDSFFDAVYWSTISLTTVGYGDIYPVSTVGRFVAMLSSFFGIAIVALPAGVITAEYMNSINNKDD